MQNTLEVPRPVPPAKPPGAWAWLLPSLAGWSVLLVPITLLALFFRPNLDFTCISAYTDECMNPDAEVMAVYGAAEACSSKGPSVCLIPVGAVSLDTIESVAAGLEEKTGLPVHIGRPMALPDASYDIVRDQFNSRVIIDELEAEYGAAAAGASGKRLVVGLTPGDLRGYFAFGERSTKNDGRTIAIVSTYNMRTFIFDSGDRVKLRAQKMLTKYAAITVLGMQPSYDPHSLLYDDILSYQDLDRMSEDLPGR